MTFLVDTSVLIAYSDQRDERHADAAGLLRRALEDREFGNGYISDFIIDEVLTLAYARSRDKSRTVQLGEFLFTEFEFVHTSPEIFKKSWELFQKSTGLSFTDCTLVVLMKTFGIQSLLSFDSGFDQTDIHRMG